MKALTILVLGLPLLGALHHIILGRSASRRRVEAIACGAVLLPLAAAAALLVPGWTEGKVLHLLPWFAAGSFTASFSLLLDPLSLSMAFMVCFISLCVHVYSVFFLRRDEGYVRYFFFLNLFVFCMLVIALADNLVFLFLGWEGVGLCSYALIGYWFTDTKRVLAGNKAFIMTRIGDVAFLVALALLFVRFGTLSVASIASHASLLSPATATLLGFLLLWAAVGKSAQLPLQVWLPDAMLGPAPVSALIHAATMVTAGVYLLMRLFPVLALSQSVLLTVALLGALTALVASCSALAQRELKRVLAWSTIGQVGFMFLAIGAGNVAASMFHLLTHACFKALLFLGAGCIVQALGEEQDIYRMGAGVRKALPQVFWAFGFGALALAAVPPFSGFFSKGEILVSVLGRSGAGFGLAWLLGLAASLLTVLYTFRMLLLVFFGGPSAQKPAGSEGIPAPMIRVLWPLAFLSLLAGGLNLPGTGPWSGWLAELLSPVVGPWHHPEGEAALWHMALEVGLSLAGILIAVALYGPGNRIGRRRPALPGIGLQGILLEGFKLDRLYELAVVRPYQALAGWLWRDVDEKIVDGTAERTGRLMALASSGVRLWTTGRISTYLSMLLAGLVFILLILLAGAV